MSVSMTLGNSLGELVFLIALDGELDPWRCRRKRRYHEDQNPGDQHGQHIDGTEFFGKDLFNTYHKAYQEGSQEWRVSTENASSRRSIYPKSESSWKVNWSDDITSKQSPTRRNEDPNKFSSEETVV